MIQLNAANCPVSLSQGLAKTMIRFIRLLYRLHRLPSYRDRLTPTLPESARFDPGHDAVMMGYDFHITPEGPRLIEVNTNAGGALLAWQAQAAANGKPFPFHGQRNQIMDSFNEEMRLFSNGQKKQPECVIILDEEPEKQFLYNEMQQFVALFAQRGIYAAIAAPDALELRANTLFYQDKPVDMIYNRHCDFYLESQPMAHIRTAWLNRTLCLSPNPRIYGLLSDKRRMTLWSDPQELASLELSPEEQQQLLTLTPQTRTMDALDLATLWQDRRFWVFKPITSHGGKGVLLGRSISRGRFDALIPDQTLAQRLAPPAIIRCPDREGPVKTDFRFFVYRHKILGIAARIYQGQITTFRENGSGYAPVSLTMQQP
ncbi:MAG: hypothetical protein HQL75_11500 [Magnetococcales bacterium]|nr:hypothetical protein [Magnetococcales bacterium]